VTSTAISNNATPPYIGWLLRFDLLGKPAASPEAQTARVGFVRPGYFGTLHMPLLQGRIWNSAETEHGALLVLVNQRLRPPLFPEWRNPRTFAQIRETLQRSASLFHCARR
jgi:hypothetical protein